MMEDIFFHQVLIDASSSGTFEDNVDTPSKITTIKTGSQRLDTFQHPAKAALLDISLLQLDGTDILKSGTTKPSTLRIASELMMPTSIASPSLLKATSLLPVEKTKK